MFSNRTLHRHLVYPAVVALRGEFGVFEALRHLQAIEHWSADQLAEHQLNKLRNTLRYAYDRCTYYRSAWPSDALGVTDALAQLQSLPFIDKVTLQQQAAALRAQPGPTRVTVKTTGGSTGQAVTVTKDRPSLAAEMAASWLGYGWMGIRRGDRAIRLWGDPFTWKRRLRFMAADMAMNRIRFSAFAFGEADLERYWRKSLRFRADYLYGYTSMLTAFAAFVRDRGYDGQRLRLKAVVSTSEVLTSAHKRLISETFGCPVQDEYGCGEVGPIAYACRAGRLHIMSDNVFVEVLDADGKAVAPGEMGELVVTDLNNRAMPLIRYRIGDFAVPAQSCTCGRPFPALEKIVGRAYDFVVDMDGRRFHGEFFMYLFEELRQRGLGVDQFQVVQFERDQLRFDLVTAAGIVPEQEQYLCDRIAQKLAGMHVSMRRVSHIPRARSGKIRLIVNDVSRTAAAEPAVGASVEESEYTG